MHCSMPYYIGTLSICIFRYPQGLGINPQVDTNGWLGNQNLHRYSTMLGSAPLIPILFKHIYICCLHFLSLCLKIHLTCATDNLLRKINIQTSLNVAVSKLLRVLSHSFHFLSSIRKLVYPWCLIFCIVDLFCVLRILYLMELSSKSLDNF